MIEINATIVAMFGYGIFDQEVEIVYTPRNSNNTIEFKYADGYIGLEIFKHFKKHPKGVKYVDVRIGEAFIRLHNVTIERRQVPMIVWGYSYSTYLQAPNKRLDEVIGELTSELNNQGLCA